ncbi:DUF305 domain-containing protein [Gloeocapsa sp. BRSZ]
MPLVSFSLAACSGTASEQAAESRPSSSTMAQMDHGSMMNMDLGPADENFDLRFIDAIILHHRGAIQMAEEAQQKTSRSEIQQLAANIIESQSPKKMSCYEHGGKHGIRTPVQSQ